MKILCIPDLHCWYTNYARPADDGIDTRLEDWRRTARALVDVAVRERCNLAVAPGDLFDTPRPPARAIIEVATLFRQLESAGIPVVGCNGNHDAGAPGQPGPVDVLAALGEARWGITAPRVAEAAGIQVAVLPWAKPAAFLHESESAGDLVGRTTEALVAIARALAAQVDPTRPAVLIGHWAIAGCTLSSGQLLTGGEPALPLTKLQAGPWQAVVMGHIHRPQMFPGRPVVLHAGALERRDFGEENDLRGAYVVDLGTGEVTWHDLPARRFLTIDLDETDLDWIVRGGDPEVPLSPWGDEPSAVADAIVRVRYRATEELARKIDHSALILVLERLGAHHVAGVYPEIVRGERARAEGLTEQTSPLQALDRWLALRGDLSDKLRAEVLAAAEVLMREVA